MQVVYICCSCICVTFFRLDQDARFGCIWCKVRNLTLLSPDAYKKVIESALSKESIEVSDIFVIADLDAYLEGKLS